MNAKLVDDIANAVLYEGYMLYPYRPSSVKNRQRWNFGVVYPKSYSEMQKGTDNWFMQTECLTMASSSTELSVKIRFLQAVARTVGELQTPLDEFPLSSGNGSEPDIRIVQTLHVGNQILQSWQEAIEREIILPVVSLTDSAHACPSQVFTFPGGRALEPFRGANGLIVGLIIRTKGAIAIQVDVAGSRLKHDLFKITVRISNITTTEDSDSSSRDRALMQSLLSAHTVLSVNGGEFISLLDPPDALKEIASRCNNVGTWPVLAGEEGQRDGMLSSPIILYDYPQIAPESPGDLFDGTEIDEILALRILTLTDEEKREMRQADGRACQILERTESMPAEHFMKLHGVLRGVAPVGRRKTMNEWEWRLLEDKAPAESVNIAGVEVRPGHRVRLHPGKRGDVMDIALAGKTAMVESIEQDYEGKFHVCVVADDDPGRDVGIMRQPGHRFFFDPEEVEPLPMDGDVEDATVQTPSILIAGIGNVFLGDDAFGVEVVQRLAGRTLPESVKVIDYGIRGLDLAYALLDAPDVTILVDACPRGGKPGSLYVIEPDLNALNAPEAEQSSVDAHSMNPMNVIRMAKAMDGDLGRILLVGCEPATLGPEEGQMGLSEPVAAAVGEAAMLIETLVGKIRNGDWPQ